MAQLSNPERNTLRKCVRLLDMRENRGQQAYDQMVEATLAQLREMLQPTERFKLHVPEEYAFDLQVAWYETAPDGVKHLFLTVTEHPVEQTEEGQQQQQGG